MNPWRSLEAAFVRQRDALVAGNRQAFQRAEREALALFREIEQDAVPPPEDLTLAALEAPLVAAGAALRQRAEALARAMRATQRKPAPKPALFDDRA